MKRQISLLLFSLFLIIFLGQFSIAFAQIRGRLLKSNGRPLPYTEIELVPVDSDKIVTMPNLIGVSDTYGKFVFNQVPKGKYTLSINFDDKPTDLSPYSTFFYPNAKKRTDAEVFEIETNNKIRVINFKLPPPLLQIKITGKVVNSNGTPMQDVYVHLHDVMFDDTRVFNFKIKTDKTGSFALKGFENRLYQVGAILLARPLKPFEPFEPLAMTSTQVFLLTPQTSSMTITLKIPDEDRYRNNIGKLILKP